MTLRTDSKYPLQRAYVLKLSREATPDALSGRIENFVSGKRQDFTCARELLDVVACDIAQADPEAPGGTEA